MTLRTFFFAMFVGSMVGLGGCETAGTTGMPAVGLGSDCGKAAGTQCEPGLSCLNRKCWKECASNDDCASFESVSACEETPEFAGVTKVCVDPSAGGAGGGGGATP